MNNFSWIIESFDPIKFDKIKSYAERKGWKNIRWVNGFTVGIPPRPKSNVYYNEYQEQVFSIPVGQLELF